MITATKINSVEIKTIPLEIKRAAAADLEKDVSDTNLLAIGEVHGVRENAFIYYTLFHDFSFNTVALEFPATLREDLLKFVETGKPTKSISSRKLGDGRINLEYLALIKKLWEEKKLKNIICFATEESTDTWNERDEIYAKNFLKSYDHQQRTLLIAGNYHTKKQRFFSEYEKGELVPMCYILKKELDDFPECKIKYHSGSFYNFGINDFEEYDNVETNCIEKVGTKSYLIHLKKGNHITAW